MTLDCENLDSSIKSLSQIFKIPQRKLLRFLFDIDLNKISEEDRRYETLDVVLFKLLQKKYTVNLQYDNSFWFHNTRIMRNYTFEEGILPLEKSYPLLSSFLEELSKKVQYPTKKVSRPSQNALYLIASKLQNKSIGGGPFGFLVKQAAIDCIDENHNYLKIPEIVEDIISAQYHEIKEEIMALYWENTHSYIVKFQSNKTDEYFLGCALYYIYKRLKGEPLSLDSNTCFDNKGNAIKASEIEKIETYKKYSSLGKGD